MKKPNRAILIPALNNQTLFLLSPMVRVETYSVKVQRYLGAGKPLMTWLEVDARQEDVAAYEHKLQSYHLVHVAWENKDGEIESGVFRITPSMYAQIALQLDSEKIGKCAYGAAIEYRHSYIWKTRQAHTDVVCSNYDFDIDVLMHVEGPNYLTETWEDFPTVGDLEASDSISIYRKELAA